MDGSGADFFTEISGLSRLWGKDTVGTCRAVQTKLLTGSTETDGWKGGFAYECKRAGI